MISIDDFSAFLLVNLLEITEIRSLARKNADYMYSSHRYAEINKKHENHYS